MPTRQETIDQIVERVIRPSLETVERKQWEHYQHFLLDGVKLSGGKRTIEDMTAFKREVGEDLVTAVTRNLDDLKRKGIAVSEMDFLAAANYGGEYFATHTDNYKRVPRNGQARPITQPQRKDYRNAKREKGGLAAVINFVKNFMGEGTKNGATRPYAARPTKVVLEKQADDYDRVFYGRLLMDTISLVTLTDPQIRKRLQPDNNLYDVDFSNTQGIRKLTEGEFSSAVRENFLRCDETYRLGDKRILAGLYVINSITKIAERKDQDLSDESFRLIIQYFQPIFDEITYQHLELRLTEPEWKSVLALYQEARIVDHQVEVVRQRVRTVTLDGSLGGYSRSAPTGVNPHHEIVLIPRSSVQGAKTTVMTPEEIRKQTREANGGVAPTIIDGPYPLLPDLRSPNTVRDPVFLAALNLKYDMDSTLKICELFGALERIGYRNGQTRRVIDNLIAYSDSLDEIVRTNRRGGVAVSLDEVKKQWRESERDAYQESYKEKAEQVLDLANALAGNKNLLEKAQCIADLLDEDRVTRTSLEPKIDDKYTVLGIKPNDARILSEYEQRMRDPNYRPSEEKIKGFLGTLIKVATKDLLNKSVSGRVFRTDTYRVYLDRLFEDITPDEREGVPNGTLDDMWKTAHDAFQKRRSSLPFANRSPEEEIKYQVLGYLVAKAERIHAIYSELYRISPSPR